MEIQNLPENHQALRRHLWAQAYLHEFKRCQWGGHIAASDATKAADSALQAFDATFPREDA